ncbi:MULTISPECIES: penicillin-binding transpeptidase domain-containing protein [Nocardiaceae]|jgi:cell division protein FtsI/penicillin-binding protein 2|uniref:penicillin-binding transpeptidase domain-containing protein n=1 Tax=Nocardiaceae TaxID=85025 RepID=UPI0012D31BCD|nr:MULTISPECIES: penicillin-binding transpeptidase domain-containing protein [Rhodococcus]MBJ7320800.1 penicillin-binding transpeptidase domain-containing protein [Rhodococcus sp. (in: high G+C Gram-positive bacteria)]MDJ0001413.1 penicillin-binding transpeptidase domain-containing protein [Rhodococcus fascians]MDJ0467967.1 penicillin-binding transpeptidase domain-containing protein [Rhodococcus fascians]WQH30964.1 penicillin-binding transpeptidase domain-containing protein [Rhodococcus fascian
MRGRLGVVTVIGAVVGAYLTGCTPKPDGPEPAAQAFLAAFEANDIPTAAADTDKPDAAATALSEAWTNLQAEALDAETTSVRVDGDTATVGYTYRWQLPKDRVWTYDGQLNMGRSAGEWVVRWTASDIHPKLGDTQTMALRSTAAPRARVNERSGTDVLVPGVVHRIKFDASAANNVVASATALSTLLTPFDASITAQSIVESATSVDGDYPVALLRDSDFEPISAALTEIPGVTASDESDLVSTDPTFAPDLVGQVKKAVIDDVDGKAGWSVVTSNRNGVDIDVLTDTPPEPAPSFSISLDRNIQVAAQRAVNARAEQAMTVVIQPSTGAILAVAQNPAADRDGPVASAGLYPPGSTFKIITAGAAISSGLATPGSTVPCPGRIEIGERSVPNYNEFALGDVTMSTAFTRSCNTSFAKLASEMSPDALTVAASQFGVGPDYDVVGLPTDSGSVPPADELVQRTEDGFGQGKVVVSTFGMALAAATVAHGSTPVPNLLVGRETAITGDHPPIEPAMVDGLRGMMRSVVTSGTAERIADQGEVYGKTGEAEVEGGSHSWFVGYRGDIAFATLVVRGGSSDNAVAVTREMFEQLPPGY